MSSVTISIYRNTAQHFCRLLELKVHNIRNAPHTHPQSYAIHSVVKTAYPTIILALTVHATYTVTGTLAFYRFNASIVLSTNCGQ